MGDYPAAAPAAECPHLAITLSSISSNGSLMKVSRTHSVDRSVVGHGARFTPDGSRSPQDEHASLYVLGVFTQSDATRFWGRIVVCGWRETRSI